MRHFFLTVFLAVFAISANAVQLQNFENLEDLWIYEEDEVTKKEGIFFVLNNDFAPIHLAENPKKAGINTSETVAAVNVFVETFAANSGIIKINFADGVVPKINYPENPLGVGDEIPVYYDVFRFKYYKGNLLNKNVELEPNGTATSPNTIRTAMGEDEWEYITFNLEYKNYQNFQIRVNRNEAGSASATNTQPNELIYVDDFELYNSEVGPDDPSAIKLALFEEDNISCTSLGNNQFQVNASLNKLSNVQIDLVSLTGQVTNIYNQSVQGDLEVPFRADNQGVYFVRMVIDGKQSAAKKIIVQ